MNNNKSIKYALTALVILTLSAFLPAFATSTSSWSVAAPIPIGVEGYGAARVSSLNMHYYIAGYAFGIGDSNLNQIYTAATNTWASGAALPGLGRAELAAVADSGTLCSGGPCVYALGGRPFDGALYRYDPVADTWSTLAPMLNPVITEHGVALHGGKIYVAGGRPSQFSAPGPNPGTTSLQIYDITSDTWIY